MPVIASRIAVKGAALPPTCSATTKLAGRRLEALVIAESGVERERFDERGQLLPRERVARLIDRGTSFLELSRLAGLNMHDDDGKKSVLGGGSIVGIGVVAGRRCLVSASDSALKGGTVAPMGLKKALRAQEIARENKLPLVYLVESGGANLMYQANVRRGGKFHNQARFTMGIPADRWCTACHPAVTCRASTTLRWCVARTSTSPAALVKAAIGEDAPRMVAHAEVTAWVNTSPRTTPRDRGGARADHQLRGTGAPAAGRAHRFEAEELMGLVPVDERDPRRAIVRAVMAPLRVQGRL
jgi:geranyl-CoA carboxylase beta subunit